MMRKNFRILQERPVEYEPLAALRAYHVKVNRLSSLIAKCLKGGYSGQHLVAITPDNLPHTTCQLLMDGQPFVGVDGVTYIIQR